MKLYAVQRLADNTFLGEACWISVRYCLDLDEAMTDIRFRRSSSMQPHRIIDMDPPWGSEGLAIYETPPAHHEEPLNWVRWGF